MGAAFLGLALTACGDTGTSGEIWIDNLPTLVAEPGMRIGSVDDPEVGFTRVSRVDVDRDGDIYVLEAAVPEIRVYSPDGRILRRIGRRGQGPGEFEGSPRFGVLGDTVWTIDGRTNRITLFDRQGTILSAERTEGLRVPLPSSYGHLLPWLMRPDGKFISHFGRVSYNRNDDEPTGVSPTDRIPVPFVLFDATGEITDTVGWAPRPPPRMWRPPGQYDTSIDFAQVDGRQVVVPRHPIGMPWWEALVDGYLLVDVPTAQTPEDGTFTVTRFGVAGDTVYHRVLHYLPEPYTSETLDSIAARGARGEVGGMLPMYSPNASVPDDWRRIAQVLRGEMDFPDFKAPVEYPWVGQDQSVWLRRWDGLDPMARWILLDDAGLPRGELALASTTRLVWSGGDAFWAVEPDEFDVPWLVRYEIRPG